LDTSNSTDSILQLNSFGLPNSRTSIYIASSNIFLNNFEMSFDIKMVGDGDSSSLHFGGRDILYMYGKTDPGNNPITIQFELGKTKPMGIYLYGSQGEQAGFYNTILNNNTWKNINIKYRYNSSSTLTISLNNVKILEYKDPNNTQWVQKWGLGYIGFTSLNTDYAHSFYVRNLTLGDLTEINNNVLVNYIKPVEVTEWMSAHYQLRQISFDGDIVCGVNNNYDGFCKKKTW
jgi:hypothetical protein